MKNKTESIDYQKLVDVLKTMISNAKEISDLLELLKFDHKKKLQHEQFVNFMMEEEIK